MSPLSIQVPFPVFQDRDGQPLENGYVWIGTANLNPQTNPVVAYYDAALTIVAAQPLRTINGYISRAGTPAQVYVDGVSFSILVQDSKGSMVYNFPNGTGISPDACGVTYNPPFTGGVAYPVCEKLEQTVSVMDFGATGDGTTNDTAAIQAALNSGKKGLYFPEGEYIITATLNVPKGVTLFGANSETTILNGYALSNTDAIFSLTGGDQFSTISDMTFKGQASGSKSIGIKVTNGYYAAYLNLRFINLSFGMLLDEAGSCLIENCHFTNCLIGAQCMGGSAYKFDSSEFQYGTDVGVKLVQSPTSGFPTSVLASQCGFTSNIGFDVPRVPGAFGGSSIAVDNCYFEGDLNFATLTKAFRVGETGSGNSVVMASISNCRIAGSNSAKSIFANTTRLYFANNIVGAEMEVQNTVLGAEYIGNEFVGTFTNNTLATLTLDLGTIQTNWIDNATYDRLRLAQAGRGIDVRVDRVRPVVTNDVSLGDNALLFTNAYLTGGLFINTVRWTTGAGSPEGSLSAPVGSLYTRTDGGANTTLYVKESGTGNTGWVAK